MGISGKLRHGSLFSGMGGFDLASEWAGWENIFHCEWNPFCQKILKYYWPEAQSFTDITKTDFTRYANKIDVLTGGFPCQPFSNAGKRLGTEDNRHLWPEMLRAIREISPKWVVGENVPGIINWGEGMVFEQVCTDLEDEGYEVQTVTLPAAGINAPHKRDRIWFVAYRKNDGLKATKEINKWKKYQSDFWSRIRGTSNAVSTKPNATDTNKEFIQGRSNTGGIGEGRKKQKEQYMRFSRTEWEKFPTQPPLCNGDDGFSYRIHKETISKHHSMDRDLVIKGALDAERLEVNFETGKVYSRTIRGKKGQKVQLKGCECNGYRVHSIYFEGVKKQCRAHQIVWIAANGLYDKSKFMIDHINRRKSDNRLENLRLVTAQGNRDNSPDRKSKFSQDEKDAMHLLHTNGHMSFREIANDFGCSKSRVHQIVTEHKGTYGITFSKWRKESIKAAGNAIVPDVALQIFEVINKMS